MSRFLSPEQVENVRTNLETFCDNISLARESLETVLRDFNSEEVVQSFYESGDLGERNEEKLNSYLTEIKGYEQDYGKGGDYYNAVVELLER